MYIGSSRKFKRRRPSNRRGIWFKDKTINWRELRWDGWRPGEGIRWENEKEVPKWKDYQYGEV